MTMMNNDYTTRFRNLKVVLSVFGYHIGDDHHLKHYVDTSGLFTTIVCILRTRVRSK